MQMFTPEECDQLISGEKCKRIHPDRRIKSSASPRMNMDEFHESLQQLTPREAEILTKLIVGDVPQKVLAVNMNLSEKTINSYKMSAMRKLGIVGDVKLIKFFFKNGILHL